MKRFFGGVLALLLAVQAEAEVKLPAVLGSEFLGRGFAPQPRARNHFVEWPHV